MFLFFYFEKVITEKELHQVQRKDKYREVNKAESGSQLGGVDRINQLHRFFDTIVTLGCILHILSKNIASQIKMVLKYKKLIIFFEIVEENKYKSYRIYDRHTFKYYRSSKQRFLQKYMAKVVNYRDCILIDYNCYFGSLSL